MELIELFGKLKVDELMELAKDVLSLLEQKDKQTPFKVGEYRLYLDKESNKKAVCKDCGHCSKIILEGKGVEGKQIWHCELYNIQKNPEGYCENFKESSGE